MKWLREFFTAVNIASFMWAANFGLLVGLSASPVVSGTISGILALGGVILTSIFRLDKDKINKNLATTDTEADSTPLDMADGKKATEQGESEADAKQEVDLMQNQIVQLSLQRQKSIAVLVVMASLGLPVGLTFGIWARTNSLEKPEKNLTTYYSKMGFNHDQVKEIVDHHAKTLAGKYRNIQMDCADLGLTSAETQVIVNNVVNSKLVVPLRHSESHSDRTFASEKPLAAVVPSADKTASEHNRNEDRFQIWSGKGETWLGELAAEITESIDGTRESEITHEIDRYRALLKEVIFVGSLEPKASAFAFTVWNKEMEYLDGLKDESKGASLPERKSNLQQLRVDISKLLNPNALSTP